MRQDHEEQHRRPAQHSQPEGQHRGELHVAEADRRGQRHQQVSAADHDGREQPAADRGRLREQGGHPQREEEGADQRIRQPQRTAIDAGQHDADRHRGQQEQKKHGPDRSGGRH
jgi:hypothetical protein